MKVSKSGGRLAAWRSEGNEMIYETVGHRLMKVACKVRDGIFQVGEARPIADLRLGDTGVLPNFDVRNGQLVAFLPPAGEKPKRNQLTFRFHFFEELERQLPGQ